MLAVGDVRTGAAVVFALATAGAVLFQVALALGAPWGELAMGGRYPGRFPMALRVAAVVQAIGLAVLGVIVLTRAGIIGSPLDAPWLIWAVVLFSVVSVVANALSRSRRERRLWVPVTGVMLASSLILALA